MQLIINVVTPLVLFCQWLPLSAKMDWVSVRPFVIQ